MFDYPARVVYGTIVVAALLDAESALNENYLDTIGAVLIAMAVYWLAHGYSDFAGSRLQHGTAMRVSDLALAMRRESAILAGAVVPLLALVVTDVAGGTLNDGVNAGIYTAAAMLLLIELVAGLRAHLSAKALVVQSLFGALMGALVIALKLVLH